MKIRCFGENGRRSSTASGHLSARLLVFVAPRPYRTLSVFFYFTRQGCLCSRRGVGTVGAPSGSCGPPGAKATHQPAGQTTPRRPSSLLCGHRLISSSHCSKEVCEKTSHQRKRPSAFITTGAAITRRLQHVNSMGDYRWLRLAWKV